MPLKSQTFDAPRSLSDLLLVEVNRDWSREKRTLAPTTLDLPFGTVLAKDEDGNLVPYLKAAGDNQAVAVSIEDKKTNPAASPVMVMARGAVLAASELFFLPAVNATQKTAAKAQLRALGLVPQE